MKPPRPRIDLLPAQAAEYVVECIVRVRKYSISHAQAEVLLIAAIDAKRLRLSEITAMTTMAEECVRRAAIRLSELGFLIRNELQEEHRRGRTVASYVISVKGMEAACDLLNIQPPKA